MMKLIKKFGDFSEKTINGNYAIFEEASTILACSIESSAQLLNPNR
jgi:hypothetical protein